MATNASLKNQLTNKEPNESNIATSTLKSLMNNADIKRRFTEILKEREKKLKLNLQS